MSAEMHAQNRKDSDTLSTGTFAISPVEEKQLFVRELDAKSWDSFAEQVSLIRILDHPHSVRIVESCLDSALPRVTYGQLRGQKLGALLNVLTDEDRTRLFCQTIDLVSNAMGLRLYHGSLSVDSLFVAYQPLVFLQVNYLDRFSLHSKRHVCDDELKKSDIIAAGQISKQLIAPLLEIDGEYAIHGLLLGRLKSLFLQLDEGLFGEESFQYLVQVADDISALRNAQCDATQDLTGELHPANENDDSTIEFPTNQSSSPDSMDNTEICILNDKLDTASDATMELKVGDNFGRYQILKKLGEGGMGEVFLALDADNKSTVAVKILRAQTANVGQAIRRFKKEARLLAEVQNEYVTRLFESSEIGGKHFIAMEFVEGTDLKRWMLANVDRSEEVALTLVRDIARGLVDAHAQEIVHRDIKPENVLLAVDSNQFIAEDATKLGLDRLSVKLTDFGIARHISQSESMEMTKAGSILGTPRYMAPEQCKGVSNITPAADVYALGIILYELLAGNAPFNADDPMALAAAHCFDAVPDIRRKNQMVSDETYSMLAKMLHKDRNQRLSDARQVAKEIDRIQQGNPNDIISHPAIPDCNRDQIWSRSFEWNLKSSPASLWPIVSDTNRLNRAIGLKSVKFSNEKDDNGMLRKFGEFKLFGMVLRWEEHPFEWIEGSQMCVLREFESGPFVWFTSRVELQPTSSGGTLLRHTLTVLPRNLFGRLVAHVEIGWKSRKSLEKVYHRIDQNLQRNLTTSDEPSDPFENPPNLSRELDNKIRWEFEKLLTFGISAKVASRLEEYLRAAPAQPLAHIRPFALAIDLGLDPDETLDACLHAASIGIFEISWDIICPTCRVPSASSPFLDQIKAHTQCDACDIEFQSNIDSAIELVFRANSEFRPVDISSYCVGGPQNSPHILGQFRLAPNEFLSSSLMIAPGEHLIRTSGFNSQQKIHAKATGGSSCLNTPLSKLAKTNAVQMVRAGRIDLELTNDSDREQLVRIEKCIKREHAVTATSLTTHPKFQTLFPNQGFRDDNPVRSEDLTLSYFRIHDLDEIQDEAEETELYSRISRIINNLSDEIHAKGGSVIRRADDGLFASFRENLMAFRLAMGLEKIREDEGVDLRMSIHRGRTLVATQNGRTDYFGTASRIVRSLSNHVKATWVLTDCVFCDPVIQERTRDLNARKSDISLPGNRKMTVMYSCPKSK